MSNAIVSQVPRNLMFRYRLNCRKLESKPKGAFELPADFSLPRLGAFEGQKPFADVRVGWIDQGLAVELVVTGKKQSLWCRESQILESDGIQLWVDTRDTHNVHRATKFCHWVMIMPTGGGGGKDKPVVSRLKINRSREDSPCINRGQIEVASNVTKTGYTLSMFLAADALNGWDTSDHRVIGFNYAIQDRELGWQSLAIGPEMPIQEDPSLWQSLKLID